MNVLFRADASIEIGTGHVMRCLTLADALKKEGADCGFVCREHAGNMIDVISERGFRVYPLALRNPGKGESAGIQCKQLNHAAWLGTCWQEDAAQTLEALKQFTVDWLIVDHYALDNHWEKILRSACRKLMVIDDLADRQHDCDLLLDQNLGRSAGDYAGLVPRDSTVLVGPSYALLRPEFAALREYSLNRRVSPQLKRLLISMGGIDKDDATSRVLEALNNCSLPDDCHICVVMGNNAPWLSRVRSIAASMPWPTEVLVNVNDMAQLMAESDLAIGAAGSTSWERCCLGLPTLLVITAENQKDISAHLSKKGAAKIIGRQKDISSKNMRDAVESLLISEDAEAVWVNMKDNASGVCNGLGVRRVALSLMPPTARDKRPIYLRPIMLDDTDIIYEWQVDKRTRRYAHNPNIPSYEDHCSWVKQRLSIVEGLFEIIMHGDEAAGVIRLDPVRGNKNSMYLVSIYVSPDRYRLGLAKAALYMVRKLAPDAELIAEIHAENIASAKLFENTGFVRNNNNEFVYKPENIHTVGVT